MHTLELFLLGASRVLLDGCEVMDFKTRKERALLIYLVVSGKRCSREELAGLFWAELSEEKARSNLRNALTNLRKAIGSQWIESQQGISISNNFSVSVDVQRLKLAVDMLKAIQETPKSQESMGASHNASPNNGEQLLNEIHQSLKLYCGEFLQGFHISKAVEFEEWVRSQREQYTLLVLQGLEMLAQQYLNHGYYDQGLSVTHRLLLLEPWSESFHRLQMMLLAQSGQQVAALVQYNRCKKILEEEFNLTPAPETTTLYEQIKAQFNNINAALPRPPLDATALASSTLADASLTELTHHDLTCRPSLNEFNSSEQVSPIPNNLIFPLASFIGRMSEIALVHQRLSDPDCRLLTIAGPGGIGKTSLALECGRQLLEFSPSEFPDGIFFVSLEGINHTDGPNLYSASFESRHWASTEKAAGSSYFQSDPSVAKNAEGSTSAGAIILKAIAEQIDTSFQLGISTQQQLIDHLRSQRLLIILDNIEHLLSGVEELIGLLTKAPKLKLLVTSRVLLNVRGEATLTLGQLSMNPILGSEKLETTLSGPSSYLADYFAEELWRESDAVAMFVQRIQYFDPTFSVTSENIHAIVEICQLVGGLPLALDMASAWSSFYSCDEIAQQLKKTHSARELLTASFEDYPKRHCDLQTVFDDSWKLLPLDAQRALAQLSIFSGKFTRDAAHTIADISLGQLTCLRNHSLIQLDNVGQFSLHPLLRQFAADKWCQLTEQEPTERDLLCQNHSRYFLQFVEYLVELSGQDEVEAIRVAQKNHTEIIQGWKWTVQHGERYLFWNSMLGLFRYLELTNRSVEGKALFDVGQVVPEFVQANYSNDSAATWLLVAHSHFLRRLGEYEQVQIQLKELVARLSAIQLDDSISWSAPPIDNYTFALSVLGWAYYERGEYNEAGECFSTVYERANSLSNQAFIMQSLNGLGSVSFSTKHYLSAQSYYQKALGYAQQHADLHHMAIILGNLAACAQATKAFKDADDFLQMRLQVDHKTHNVRQMAVSYHRLGQLALRQDDYAKTEMHLRESLVHFEQLGQSPEIMHVLLDLGRSLLRQNKMQQAEAQCLRSLQLAVDAQMRPRILAGLTLLAEIRSQEEKKDAAATLIQMVNRNEHIPAATQKIAQRLQKRFLAELGEKTLAAIHQDIANVSLEEFSQRYLVSQ